MRTSNIFVCNLPRLIQKLHPPILGAVQCHDLWRLTTPRINEVQLDPSFALAIALAAVLTIRPCLVAFEMPLATGETSCADTLWFATLAAVVAIAGGHQIGLGIRLRSDSFDLLARLRSRRVGWCFALVGGRSVCVCAGLVGRQGARGAGSQWIGIHRTKLRLRGGRLMIVGRQGWQDGGAQACVCADALITVILRRPGAACV